MIKNIYRKLLERPIKVFYGLYISRTGNYWKSRRFELLEAEAARQPFFSIKFPYRKYFPAEITMISNRYP